MTPTIRASIIKSFVGSKYLPPDKLQNLSFFCYGTKWIGCKIYDFIFLVLITTAIDL